VAHVDVEPTASAPRDARAAPRRLPHVSFRRPGWTRVHPPAWIDTLDLPDIRQPRVLVNATVVVGVVVTAMAAVAADARFALFKPAVYTAMETTATVVGLLAAYLVFFRFRRSSRLDDLLLTCALVVLASSSGLFGVTADAVDGFSRNVATWASVGGRFAGAGVLLGAAFAPPLVLRRPVRAAWLVLGSAVAVVAAVGWSLGYTVAGAAFGLGSPASHEAALVLQIGLIAVFAAAAVGFVHRAERDDDEMMQWFAVASTLAAIASFNFAFHPSLQDGWVYTGDVFRLLFYGALVMGAAREIGRYWNDSIEAAVLQERRRIARDLHDGLAQELAFIVRRVGRTLQEDPHSTLAVPIISAAERALDESRRVIATLTRPLDEPLEVVLAEAVKDVADRVNTIAAIALDRGVRVSPDVREALVRIAREAVTNAARHGGAGIVRVELERGENGAPTVLRIVDDGLGFDTRDVRNGPSGGFGLVSMRERAQAIGAGFSVVSQPGAGTKVEVELP
jgi:signal transduction histidine kinase